MPQRNHPKQGVEGGSRSTDAQRLCDGGGQRKFFCLRPRSPIEKSWTLASSLFRRFAPYTQTKTRVQPNLRFSFISPQNLLKSRVFATNIKGLFFPALRVEQAHFSPLTTCLTTCGDFWLIFDLSQALFQVDIIHWHFPF